MKNGAIVLFLLFLGGMRLFAQAPIQTDVLLDEIQAFFLALPLDQGLEATATAVNVDPRFGEMELETFPDGHRDLTFQFSEHDQLDHPGVKRKIFYSYGDAEAAEMVQLLVFFPLDQENEAVETYKAIGSHFSGRFHHQEETMMINPETNAQTGVGIMFFHAETTPWSLLSIDLFQKQDVFGKVLDPIYYHIVSISVPGAAVRELRDQK